MNVNFGSLTKNKFGPKSIQNHGGALFRSHQISRAFFFCDLIFTIDTFLGFVFYREI